MDEGKVRNDRGKRREQDRGRERQYGHEKGTVTAVRGWMLVAQCCSALRRWSAALRFAVHLSQQLLNSYVMNAQYECVPGNDD